MTNNKNDRKGDAGGHGERGGQREENRRDNPQQPGEDGTPERGTKMPDQQKEDARRRQESGIRKG